MKRWRFFLGGVAIAVSLAYLLITGVKQSAATHVNLAGLLNEVAHGELPDVRLQLGGSIVVEGSIQWDEYRSRPAFTITDGVHFLRVQYSGQNVLPDTFQDRAQVILEGRYNSAEKCFEAQLIYAKCPSRYEGQNYERHRQANQDD